MKQTLDDLLAQLAAHAPEGAPQLQARVWAAISRRESVEAPLAVLTRARWIAAAAALVVGVVIGGTSARVGAPGHELAVFQSDYVSSLGEIAP